MTPPLALSGIVSEAHSSGMLAPPRETLSTERDADNRHSVRHSRRFIARTNNRKVDATSS